MPYVRNKYKRLFLIHKALMETYTKSTSISRSELHKYVNSQLEDYEKVTIHSIEKDVQILKVEFDMQIKQSGYRRGVYLKEPVDFEAALFDHFGIHPSLRQNKSPINTEI